MEIGLESLAETKTNLTCMTRVSNFRSYAKKKLNRNRCQKFPTNSRKGN